MQIVAKLDSQRYKIWWHPALLTSELRPLLTYQAACERLNSVMQSQGRCLAHWRDPGDRNIAAKLIRANWIYHGLSQHPIKKPLLVSPGSKWTILCGDTRYMATQCRGDNTALPAVCVTTALQTITQPGWKPVAHTQDLFDLTGLDSVNGTVSFGIVDHTVEWFDIADASTSTHLHDQAERELLMQKHIDSQPASFRFDAAWIRTPVAELDKYYQPC